MAETLGQAVIEVGADTSSLEKDLKSGLGDASRSTSGPAKSLGSKFSGLVGKVAKRGLQTAGVAGGLAFGTALAKGMGRLNAIEQAEAKLGALGHSAEGVEKIMDNALASVEGTAYGLGDAASVAAGVVAAGIKPGKELEGVLKTVANSAALAGMEMGEMGAIFNKAAASGKVQGEIINQLGNRGIPILQFLADELGVTAEEVSQLAAQGKVDFKTFERAMKTGAGDAALAMGNTVSGAIANTQAALGRLGASVLKGVFSKVPSALGKVQSALNDLGPVAEKAGAYLGDGFTAAGKVIAKHGPTIRKIIVDLAKRIGALGKAWAPVLADMGKGIGDLAQNLGKVLVPAAGITLEVLTKLGDLVNWLPDPVKQFGTQVAIAALVLPRLSSGLSVVTARFTAATASAKGFTTALAGAQGAAAKGSVVMSRFGGVLKGVAGVGGLMAITKSSEKAGTALGAVGNIAGGAALGFSVGGPWGAAVGAVGGVAKSLWDVVTAGKNAEGSLNEINLSDYKSTLDEVSGAASKATRDLVYLDLQTNGSIEAATNLGVSHRDLVKAVMGNEKAYHRVTTAMSENGEFLKDNREQLGGLGEMLPRYTNDYYALRDSLGAATAAYREDTEAVRDQARATGNLKEVYEGVPKKVYTEVEAIKVKPTTDQITAISKKYGLVPDQVETIMRARNVKGVVVEVDGVAKAVRNLSETKADMKPFQKGLKDALTQGKRDSAAVTGDIGDILKNSTDVKPSRQFNTNLSGVMSDAAASAYSGSLPVGRNMSAGFRAGIAEQAQSVANAAVATVNAAIAQANAAAKVKSPSRRTMETGRFLALGYSLGMDQGTPQVERSAERLANVALSSISRVTRQAAKGGKSKRVRKALQNFLIGDNDVTKEMSKALGKRLTKQLRKLDRQVSSEYKKLQNRIQQRNDYAQEVRTANAFDLSSLSQPDEYGFSQMTFKNISSNVRAWANKVHTFAGLIRRMSKAGIPKGLIRQVIGLGIEDGTAAAQALLSASNTEIKSLASDWGVMDQNLKGVGNLAANTMYQAGVKAQEGLVKGLLKDSTLNKAAKKLSKKLTKKIKKALGIKSPSVLMEREVGTDLGLGIGIGAIKGLDKIQDQVNTAVEGLIDPVQVAPVSLMDPVRGLSPVTAPAPASPASLRATLDPSSAHLSIDYDALAEAMSRVQQRLVINNRQAGLLVQAGLTTIEGQA